nr:UxaA family hydrolase [Bacillus subtilis]
MAMNLRKNQAPLYIKVHEIDNTAIIVNDGGLPKGTVFSCGLVLEEDVPQGHKVALTDLNQGDEIVRYGEVIGFADETIKRGSWIREALVRMPAPPALDDLPLANRVPRPRPPLEGYTFEGYRNADGSAGTKNILGITTSVQCVVGVLDYAVKRIKEESRRNTQMSMTLCGTHHQYGCGVAINAPDAVIPIRTIQNLAKHPNFGGEVMVIELGCEKLLPERIASENDDDILSLQDHRGFAAMIQSILEMAEERLIRLNSRTRVSCPVSDLVIGLQCGGSDAFSGVTANPAVGYAADLLVRAGATVLFSEVTEVRDAIHLLTPRAVSEEVGQSLIKEMKWYDSYLRRGDADRSANPSPGNKKGGLSNVVEKALGSVAKSGTSPISGVLGPGERAEQKGLLFVATPASDFVCGTLRLVAGMNLQVFTTGRGTPYGLVCRTGAESIDAAFLIRALG